MLYRPSGLEHSRLGMTTSAKRLRTAVARNRVRRQVRESFRQGGIRDFGLDIVVLVRETAATATNADIRSSLAGHWRRLQRDALPRS